MSWEDTTRPHRHIVEVIEGGAGGRQQQIVDVMEPQAAFSNDGHSLAVVAMVSGSTCIVIFDVGNLLMWKSDVSSIKSNGVVLRSISAYRIRACRLLFQQMSLYWKVQVTFRLSSRRHHSKDNT